jgi:peptide chain release factor subunit 1
MTRRNEITQDTLQRLAGLRADGPLVLSAYLNLDPERFATAAARSTEVRSLTDGARREIDAAQASHEQQEQLRSDLERVESHLQAGGFPAGAVALAVFCCSSLDLFESLALPEPVESSFNLAEMASIGPLAEIGVPGRWCVTLVNRRMARILRGSESNMVQVAAFGDNVHGQHSQGGWSQARYQRSVERGVDAHLRHTADVLLSQYRRRPFAGLLVGAPQELRQRFEGLLHAYVRERLVGYLNVDVENATEEQVWESAATQIAKWDERRVAENLERLRAELGRGGRAAAGTEDVLRALEERRVEVLLYHSNQSGGPSADVLDEAIAAALAQSAEVLAVEAPDLGPLGGIAAVLRF